MIDNQANAGYTDVQAQAPSQQQQQPAAAQEDFGGFEDEDEDV